MCLRQPVTGGFSHRTLTRDFSFAVPYMQILYFRVPVNHDPAQTRHHPHRMAAPATRLSAEKTEDDNLLAATPTANHALTFITAAAHAAVAAYA